MTKGLKENTFYYVVNPAYYYKAVWFVECFSKERVIIYDITNNKKHDQTMNYITWRNYQSEFMEELE